MSKVSAAGLNVVHESEVQRQHIRVQIPAIAKIGEKTYKIRDISVGGFSIRAPEGYEPGAPPLKVKILFPFESFAFHLNLKAAAIHHDGETAGFVFQNLSPRQISVLSHVVQSCLTGLVIGEGDIINVVSRENFYAPRERHVGNDNRINRGLSRILPLAGIAVLAAAALFLLLGNIYENTSIVKSYTGVVEGETFTVRAPGNGVYHTLLAQDAETVVKGQPLAVVTASAASGLPMPSPEEGAPTDFGVPTGPGDVVIRSPCDCRIATRYPQDGEFRALGDPVMDLVPLEGDTWITASLRSEQAHRLRLEDDVHARIAGESDFLDGRVVAFLPPDVEKDIARVRVRTNQAVPTDLVGRLAYVEFVVN